MERCINDRFVLKKQPYGAYTLYDMKHKEIVTDFSVEFVEKYSEKDFDQYVRDHYFAGKNLKFA